MSSLCFTLFFNGSTAQLEPIRWSFSLSARTFLFTRFQAQTSVISWANNTLVLFGNVWSSSEGTKQKSYWRRGTKEPVRTELWLQAINFFFHEHSQGRRPARDKQTIYWYNPWPVNIPSNWNENTWARPCSVGNQANKPILGKGRKCSAAAHEIVYG